MLHLILFTIPSLCFSQNTMDPKTEIIYYLKVYNRDYKFDRFLDRWMSTFDPTYEGIKSNEFKIIERRAYTQEEIGKINANTKFEDIYVGNSNMGYNAAETEFGDYDFNKSKFEFYPFTWKYGDANELSTVINENNYFFNSAGIKEASFNSTQIHVQNHKDYIDLPMGKEEAQKLLEKRTVTNSYRTKVDRKVYIKYYYSITKDKIKSTSRTLEEDKGLFCYVYKVEIWGDKCMTDDKIAVLNAKSPPPPELQEAKENFDKNYGLKVVNKLSLEQGWIKLVDKSLLKKNNTECGKTNNFEIQLSIEKDINYLYNVKFKFRTNACLNFSTGFIYTMSDFNGNKYPLMVNSIISSTEGDYKIAAVKINRQTLQMLGNYGLADVKFQFSPTTEYPGISKYIKLYTNNACNSLDYAWVSWTAKKNEAPEYWMDESANNNFIKLVKNILNQ